MTSAYENTNNHETRQQECEDKIHTNRKNLCHMQTKKTVQGKG